MKKFIALLLALTMVVTMFVGCGAKEGKKTEGKENAESLKIIYLTPATASDFWSQVEVGIKQAKKDYEEKLGIQIAYELMGPAEEQATEEYIESFENAIAKKPDAILTATLSIDPTVPKAMEATEQGIILNFVNCGLGAGDDGAHADAYNQFYYCSNDTIGELAGQAFLEALGKKGVGTDNGVIGINMNIENEALDHRINAFRAYIEENAPSLEMTDTYYNGNDSSKSQANAENIISTHGDKLIGMYSGNNITGDGVCNAVRDASLKESFVSVAVDSDETEINALRDGFLDAIVVQNAFDQGYKCMENAILTLTNGKNPEAQKQVNCPPVIVTGDNIDSEEIQFMMNPKIK